ncbi:MAG: hypothetical protein ACYCW6_18325 [Candidatus Xenobia bacterium]
MNYNPNVIIAGARKMYERAQGALVLYVLLGLVIGAAIAKWLTQEAEMGASGALIMVLGGVIGAILGQSKMESMQVQAHLALAVAKLEQNTRPAYELQEAPIPIEALKKK